MYEQFSHNPEAVKAELAARRSHYAGKRTTHLLRRAARSTRES
jgi:hypothetical protein